MISIGMAKTDLEAALQPAQPVREERVEGIILYACSESARTLWAVLDFMDFNLHMIQTVRMAVCRKTGLAETEVHVLTTHNHGAGIPDPQKLALLVAAGAQEAMAAAVPAMMRCAVTQVSKQVSYIRRIEVPELGGAMSFFFGTGSHNGFDSSPYVEHAIRSTEEGILVYSGTAPTQRPYAPFAPGDPDLVAIQFQTEAGAPIGSVVRFAAHVNSCNRPGSFSSDYPYHVRRTMEQAFGGTAMYLSGPCGDISPGMKDKYSGEERSLGEFLAREAIRALDAAVFVPLTEMQSTMFAVRLPVRKEVLANDAGELGAIPDALPKRRLYLEHNRLIETMSFLQEKYAWGETELSDTVCAKLGFLRLNDLIIAAFPGETFSVTGKALQDAFPGRTVCTVTEHDRSVMYLPPVGEIARGGYETVCRLTGVGAEEELRSSAIRALQAFLK